MQLTGIPAAIASFTYSTVIIEIHKTKLSPKIKLTHSLQRNNGTEKNSWERKKRTPAKSPFSQLATNTLLARSSIFFWLFLSVGNSGYLPTFPAAALGLWSIKGFSLIHCVRSGLPSCCLLCSSLLFAVFARYLFSCLLMMLVRALSTYCLAILISST